MGSIMVHYFLQQQSPEWKEKHIRFMGHDLEFWLIHFLVQCFVTDLLTFRCFVSLAGAWGGLARALKVFAVSFTRL